MTSDLVTQGDTIAEDEPIKLDFYRVARNPSEFKYTNKLQFCLADKAPSPRDNSKTCTTAKIP